MGTVAGFDAAKLSLGADFSHYDGDVPGSVFKMLDYVWVKAADGDQLRPGDPFDATNYVDVHCHANVQKAWDADIPCGLYIYIVPNFPNYTMDSIIQMHYKALKAATKSLVAGLSYHAIALDVEELGVTQTDTNWQKIVKGLSDLILADPEYKPVTAVHGVVIYSSISVLNRFPALRDEISSQYVLNKYEMWMAQWAYWVDKDHPSVVTTWDELKSRYIAALNMKVLTPGLQTWDFVQWSAAFKIPPTTFIFDFNFYRGDKTACWKWWGYTPRGVVLTPPPEPTPEPKPTPEPEPLPEAVNVRLTSLETWRKEMAAGIKALPE